jgi:hypothetical protein
MTLHLWQGSVMVKPSIEMKVKDANNGAGYVRIKMTKASK